jgi:hypothetical protein
MGVDVRGVQVVLALVCAVGTGGVAASAALAVGDATTAAGEACPNEAMTGFHSSLPDCRAYELVSPVFKNGFPYAFVSLSAGGTSVIAESIGTSAGGVAKQGQVGEHYALTRGEGGWLVAPFDDIPLSQYEYSADQSGHGGEGFPDLEIVLQGEGITLILDGNTDIKKGITSSTFRMVPDAPITRFELKLPTGKYSILGANVPAKAYYSLCGQTLAMGTAITGQNGAVVKPATKIGVTGCPPNREKAARRKTRTPRRGG